MKAPTNSAKFTRPNVAIQSIMDTSFPWSASQYPSNGGCLIDWLSCHWHQVWSQWNQKGWRIEWNNAPDGTAPTETIPREIAAEMCAVRRCSYFLPVSIRYVSFLVSFRLFCWHFCLCLSLSFSLSFSFILFLFANPSRFISSDTDNIYFMNCFKSMSMTVFNLV